MQPPESGREVILLQEGGFRVSSTRISLRDKTVAIANVAVVERSTKPPVRTVPLVLMILAAIGLLLGLGMLSSALQDGVILLLASLAVFGVGLLLFHSAKAAHRIRVSAAGVSQILSVRDRDLADRLFRAINDAIVSRG
ncbi:MAG TPA: DUF6232 family protein [Thermoanaerobaculia bacterium]|nr:DUF6232 family protein [Thermoanaerobaculia bacterium]